MKRFTIKTFIFLLGFIPLFAIARIYFEFRINRNDTSYKQVKVYCEQDDIEVLFLGDSHVIRSVKNKHLPQGYFNYAKGGENIRESYIKLMTVISQHPNLRYVVLPVDYNTLSSAKARNTSIKNSFIYTKDNKIINAVFNQSLPVIFLKRILLHYLPLTSSRNRNLVARVLVQDIINFFTNTKTEQKVIIDNYGDTVYRDTSLWVEFPEEDRKIATLLRTDDQLEEPVHPLLVKIYSMMLEACKKNNIKVIGIRYPHSNEYLNMLEKYPLDNLENQYQKWREKNYIESIIDLSSIFKDRQDYFFDQEHITKEASKIFTRKIVADLQLYIQK